MPTDQGADIGGILDVSADLREVSGRAGLAEAIARRLTTPRGGLFYDLTYGYDLRRHVNAPLPGAGVIESNVVAECLKDERVQDAEVEIEVVEEALRVSVTLYDQSGPFALTLLVSQLTVQVLKDAA